MALIGKVVVFIALLYLVALAGTVLLQRRLIYFPDSRRTAPSAVGLADVEEWGIETADGARLVAWHGRARKGQPTLLYFHGNAGALADRADRMGRYLSRGIGVFMMSYRGYSGSSGRPSEKANVSDAIAAYDKLAATGVAPDQIIVYGESLGTGIAVQVALQRPVAGVILDAPYTSLVDMAELIYPRLPARSFMTDRYDTLGHIGGLTAPLLVVHGKEDRIVPVSMGVALHAAAKGPKELAVIEGAGHTDHASFGSSQIIFDWIERRQASGQPVTPAEAAE